jgi:hypothetical protein
MAKEVSPLDQAAATRDLARRGRHLAQALPQGPDRSRLLQYAEDLEEQANRLEAEGSKPGTQVQQQQMQQQQQGPSDTLDSPPKKSNSN